MNNKKGISLIVLVITILVMIILAGVVIVSLQNDNPIDKAKTAKLVDSVGSVRAAISQYAVNAQAKLDTTTGETVDVVTAMGKILTDGALGGSGTYSTWQKLGTIDKPADVKKELGVDASAVTGANNAVGTFYVDPTTGASIFVMFTTGKAETALQTNVKNNEGFVVVENETALKNIK